MGIKGGEDPRVGVSLWEDAWARRGQVLAVDGWGLADRGQIPVQRSGEWRASQLAASDRICVPNVACRHEDRFLTMVNAEFCCARFSGAIVVRARRVGWRGVPRIWRDEDSWSGCKKRRQLLPDPALDSCPQSQGSTSVVTASKRLKGSS